MTTKWSSSCFGAVSGASRAQHIYKLARPAVSIRRYATKSTDQESDIDRHERAALVEIQGLRKGDLINPPRSTRPPPLKLPERGDANVALYYIRIGRSYGSFYWRGVKAVWFNHKAAKLLKQQVQKNGGSAAPEKSSDVASLLTRSQFQLLERNSYDIGKLPFFGLLVAVFGEWLPLVVPFIPSAVPGTCRIPKQIADMRKKAEERRRISFRAAIEEPRAEQLIGDKDSTEKKLWGTAHNEYANALLGHLRTDQLLHLSSTLNLHNRMWDRFQLAPPSFLLRRKVTKHLTYLARDDQLLLKQPSAVKSLESEEVQIACDERGLDVLGKREDTLRETLHTWLEHQKKDQGRGTAILKMLFRRPNAWNTKQGS
ncbi:hypothetical protein CB0940_05679 [Cercospora beticola]|uniref:Letm1 RBD domain-containing protein n=1 Tax=Cercospora beticola TaxID=122368 RepID=A0A2G5HYS5_CERBT|nr:hypothetical protein CB0940_05679 [Cercospora beticola]PIA97402.1 hypothetical protein CB0940_05679 [Cercospora beticola]WPA98253.1 hypothetical protein RHO25_002865 [Cercospora beticola]CAK1359480.1 unnamed protein product [Cercospora beticola]